MRVDDMRMRFNPRPRAGGDPQAPSGIPRACCFNPRPRAGGDGVASAPAATSSGFNPRPRAGGDLRALEHPCLLPVSIHAPARGATPLREDAGMMSMFQSTPPRGGRLEAEVRGDDGVGFNPRPRAGGDPGSHEPAAGLIGFNPRPRAGGDITPTTASPANAVSIHAPARGATGIIERYPERCWFQSTPPRGGRRRRSSIAR